MLNKGFREIALPLKSVLSTRYIIYILTLTTEEKSR